MPHGKNQHFVPKFYLRFFSHSASKLLIGAYYIPSGLFVEQAEIKTHACDDYFYGKDGLEKKLEKIENDTGPTIAQIITKEKLPEWQSQQHKDLVFFVVLQEHRTATATDEVNEVMRTMLQAVVQEGGPDLFDHSKDAGAMAGFPSTPRMLLHMAARNSIASLDLRYKLVRNSTGRPFITSDHPVAAYNQFYEANSPGISDTGLQSRGLQLFFPLSPKYLLVVFDSDVYKIGGKAYDLTPVNATEADVKWLNILQVVNAGDSLFFSDAADEEYLRSVVASAETHKKSAKGKVDVVPAQHFGLPCGKIIAGRGVDARISLKLTFIGREPCASKYTSLVAGQRLRNPGLVAGLTRTGKSGKSVTSPFF
jgi:Protein of unknown function (DUF4238)